MDEFSKVKLKGCFFAHPERNYLDFCPKSTILFFLNDGLPRLLWISLRTDYILDLDLESRTLGRDDCLLLPFPIAACVENLLP